MNRSEYNGKFTPSQDDTVIDQQRTTSKNLSEVRFSPKRDRIQSTTTIPTQDFNQKSQNHIKIEKAQVLMGSATEYAGLPNAVVVVLESDKSENNKFMSSTLQTYAPAA